MGYNTEFLGSFKLNLPLDQKTADLINGITTTRRMKRDLNKIAKKENISNELALLKYGIDGEFYYDTNDFSNFGQTLDDTVIDSNIPPSTQPGLWCQWYYYKENNTIEWDKGEKFYNYIEWIQYIIKKILVPRKYAINGEIEWVGDEDNDKGIIKIYNNDIFIEKI